MSDADSTVLAPVVPGGFVKGHDPRRAIGGINKEIREVKALFASDGAGAREKLLLLCDNDNPFVAIKAIELVLAYAIGKPKGALTDDMQRLLQLKFLEGLEILPKELADQVKVYVLP